MSRKINETIKRRVEELSTDWNILVQERIFYPEIFKELNADKEFLQKIELEGSVNYFIHLDSDSLVLRNLFDIYGHFYLDKYFASANLETVSSTRLMAYLNGDVEPMCISGGTRGILMGVANLGQMNFRSLQKIILPCEKLIYTKFLKEELPIPTVPQTGAKRLWIF